ncbi:PIR protein, putative [Plasmodium sp.]|nr:PIR protein, putative [Plasmodium sp.]
MNIYYVKMFIFIFLINTFILPHNENYLNNHYNVSLKQNTKRTIIKSRILAQTQNHNPHYHNDPELKKIIDQLNEEAIKKYQQTHDPFKQLKEVVEKNGTKYTDGNIAEPMSTIEKELLETYEEMFGDKNHIMLKGSMYPNEDDKSDKSSTYEGTDINNAKLATTKGKDKYLKHLKKGCTRSICVCSVSSAFLTLIALAFAKKAAVAAFNYVTSTGANYNVCASYVTIFNMFNTNTLSAAVQAGTGVCAGGASDLVGGAVTSATAIFHPFGIAALVLLILAVLLIILYIWLYRRRKKSWKHECNKHLCK